MRPRGIVAVALLGLLVSSAAPAQTRDKRAAAAHFQKGRGLYDAARYDEALEEFKAGYDAFPLPGFLVNIGQCERKLDQLGEANDSFRRFLDSNPSDERLRTEVQEALSEVKAELDRRAQLAAEADSKRKHDEDEARRALLSSIARSQAAENPRATERSVEPSRSPVDLTLHNTSAAAGELRSAPEPAHKRSRWWVWTLVGVVAAGAVAGAVAVAVVETQPQPLHAGSLGLLDGRR